MAFFFAKKFIFILLSTLLLAACSITPIPISETDRRAQLTKDLERLFPTKFSFDKALTLEEAIARAVKYNINQQVKIMDITIANQLGKISTYQQLPSLTVDPEYVDRDRKPKFDQDLHQTTASLAMAWNVLDFGISYIQARQNSNQVLVAKEKLRMAAYKIIKETRRTFWLSVAAEKLSSAIGPLQEKLLIALKNSREAEDKRLQPPMQLLDFQKTLLEILSRLKQLEKELSAARINLATLVNINPGSNFTLRIPSQSHAIENLQLPPIKDLELYALLNRPELIETDYQRRIQADETRKAILRLLPGLEFNVASKYDSGDTYINNSWAEAGIKLTWNLVNLFTAPKKIELLKTKEELHELKSLALNMSVLSQVHIAYRRFSEAQGNYTIASNLGDVSQRLYQHASAGRQAAQLSELELIRREADSVLFRVRKHMAFAEFQDASGELNISLGARLLPESYDQLSLPQLSDAIGRQHQKWQTLHLKTIPAPNIKDSGNKINNGLVTQASESNAEQKADDANNGWVVTKSAGKRVKNSPPDPEKKPSPMKNPAGIKQPHE